MISFPDGKHAVAKAANVLLKKHYLSDNTEKLELTESDMTDALGAIGMFFFPNYFPYFSSGSTIISTFFVKSGYGAPDPDLMLIYGPARCHLGFPAWRMRYTEIV